MSVGVSSKNKIALAAICLSAVMLGLEITSVPSILPTLEHVLPADFKQLQWIMNAYTIAMCSSLVAMGALADRFGRKRVFMIGIVVFAIASLICGLATSAPLLIAARFLQGVSGAAMLSCQVAVLSHQFQSGPERGVAFAWWGVVFGLGLGFGPVVGGSIATFANWEWVFLIHVLIAVVAVSLARAGVVESSDPHALKIDIGGMATLSLSVFCLVYLITQGQKPEAGNPVGVGGLAIAVVSFVLFVVIEKRVARPMFDFNAFRVRKFSGALLGACGMNFSFWPFVIYFPIYLQAVLGYSSVAAGLTVLAYTMPTVVVPPLAERLLLKRGPNFVIPVGLFTIAAGFLLLHLVGTSGHASWITLLPGCVAAGIGLGLTNTPVTNTATGSLPPERAGMASGMEFSARMISLAINIAIMGFVLVSGVSAGLAGALPAGAEIRHLIDAVSAGNFAAAEAGGIPVVTARAALTQGFGWVTLYGTIAPLALGLAAAIVFGRGKPAPVQQNGERSGANDKQPALISVD
ncbi:MFS transporter [Burkholderia ubonensis]|uniref:MFS transporter n=1 Tax=Burkholderia ubonensis TaxID=101571 RepID=A0A103RFF8_9BURK|nr:MFS transporter [Burkholderia ubonensis]AOJ63257.1 MFS transporter [Burkholderia ubonensis]KVG66819.1 MFS transporter [Burkholderia ubonensis]